MANTKDLRPGEKPLRLLVYGAPGTGKTLFGGGAPKPFFLSFDPEGMTTLAGVDVEYEQFGFELSEYPRINQTLTSLVPRVKAGEFETIVFDTITFMAELTMAHILNGKGKAEIQDWGELKSRLAAIVNNAFKFFPTAHIIILAHEKLDKDEATGALIGLPAIQGGTATSLPGMFEEVYRAMAQATNPAQPPRYFLRTKADKNFIAKSRLDMVLKRASGTGLPAELEPDFPKLVNLIQTKTKMQSQELAQAAK